MGTSGNQRGKATVARWSPRRSAVRNSQRREREKRVWSRLESPRRRSWKLLSPCSIRSSLQESCGRGLRQYLGGWGGAGEWEGGGEAVWGWWWLWETTRGILAGRGCGWRRVLGGFQTYGRLFHVTEAERCDRMCIRCHRTFSCS